MQYYYWQQISQAKTNIQIHLNITIFGNPRQKIKIYQTKLMHIKYSIKTKPIGLANMETEN